jgi:uncharacterized damage-inducible protein DinB
MPEAWLRGPVSDVAPLLQPVAHALLQAREDVLGAAATLSVSELWGVRGRAAPVGFHLKHLAGSLDRLLTYARGDRLSREQRAFLESEAVAGDPPADAAALMGQVTSAIERALAQVRETPVETLLDERRVGRQQLPATVLGLLFHAAEHTTRHAGQIITTVRMMAGEPGRSAP